MHIVREDTKSFPDLRLRLSGFHWIGRIQDHPASVWPTLAEVFRSGSVCKDTPTGPSLLYFCHRVMQAERLPPDSTWNGVVQDVSASYKGTAASIANCISKA